MENPVHDGYFCGNTVEWTKPRDNLPKELYFLRCIGNQKALTSRIVMPSAYVSVLLEGSRFLCLVVKPNFSGYISSGAIHRIVSLIPRSPAVLPVVNLLVVMASPKSAKRARQLESIKMLVYSYSASESTARSVWKAHPLKISVDHVVLMQVFQPCYRVDELPVND